MTITTGIIRTIKQTRIECRLGTAPSEDMQAIQKQLRRVLEL
jgi:mRNA-degrading endonuclease toxin of MazEF toxin-antitoxin module